MSTGGRWSSPAGGTSGTEGTPLTHRCRRRARRSTVERRSLRPPGAAMSDHREGGARGKPARVVAAAGNSRIDSATMRADARRDEDPDDRDRRGRRADRRPHHLCRRRRRDQGVQREGRPGVQARSARRHLGGRRLQPHLESARTPLSRARGQRRAAGSDEQDRGDEASDAGSLVDGRRDLLRRRRHQRSSCFCAVRARGGTGRRRAGGA